MFSSKHFIDDVFDVPANWIFENYLGLPEKLSGQRVRINSLFNPHDKTPSMYLYYNTDAEEYRFKCFSTGKGGSAIDLMMHLWNVNFVDATKRILSDYTDFLKSGKRCDTTMTNTSRWIVSNHVVRGWTQADADFWSPYNISSDMLEHYNVIPLSKYTMQQINADTVEEEFTVTGKNIYGYFTDDHILYKIYQPKKRERKFIKVSDYVQGYDQLEHKPYLVITSSLKDCLAIKSMKLNVDVVAPDSENTMLSDDLILEFKQVYNGIVTVFDSDQPGISAMKTYEEKHGLPFVYMPQEKDIADIVKVHGADYTRTNFVPKLDRAIQKYEDLHILVEQFDNL